MNNPLSFTSADAIPIKLLYHREVPQFSPIHIQWIPTNKCNLNCTCCSCKKRDKSLEMDLEIAIKVIEDFASLGVKAVTITGGGEPLLHPYIKEMIDKFAECNIKIGLVTNGILLDTLAEDTIRKLTWCRISSTDERDFGNKTKNELLRSIKIPVDWAFSYVVSDSPNLYAIKRMVQFANQHNFTHIRLVADLLDVGRVDSTFTSIRKYLKDIDNLVIYQPRNSSKPCKSCLIGYIKPLIGPDFQMYHCCGVQYALKKKSLDLPKELSMGSALELNKIYQTSTPFKVNCVRCYYTQYNDILHSVQKGLKHKEFI